MRWISRTELFEDAWSRPMLRIAEDYGVSSTALKKTCDRHEIPTPPRGHWAKLEVGRGEPRPQLSPASDPHLERIRIVGGPNLPASVKEAQAAAKAASPPLDAGPMEGAREHPMLVGMRKAVGKAKLGRDCFTRVAGKGLVPLTVSSLTVERALAWLSMFLLQMEQRGYSIERTDEGARLIVLGQSIAFHIEEKSDRVVHVPTERELAEKERRDQWGYSSSSTPWRKYDERPSGKLAVVIDANSYSGLRKTFGDGKTQSLETMISEIECAFVAHAAFISDRQRQAEESRRKAELARIENEKRKAFESREDRRAKFALLIADALGERSRLLAVLAHLESNASPNTGPDAMTDWLKVRVEEINAMIDPRALEISARYAKLDFDETRAAMSEASPEWYYPRPIELHLWSIDKDADRATSLSRYEWSRQRAG